MVFLLDEETVDFSDVLPGNRETGTAILAPDPLAAVPVVFLRTGPGLALYVLLALNLFIASELPFGDL